MLILPFPLRLVGQEARHPSVCLVSRLISKYRHPLWLGRLAQSKHDPLRFEWKSVKFSTSQWVSGWCWNPGWSQDGPGSYWWRTHCSELQHRATISSGRRSGSSTLGILTREVDTRLKKDIWRTRTREKFSRRQPWCLIEYLSCTIQQCVQRFYRIS